MLPSSVLPLSSSLSKEGSEVSFSLSSTFPTVSVTSDISVLASVPFSVAAFLQPGKERIIAKIIIKLKKARNLFFILHSFIN